MGTNIQNLILIEHCQAKSTKTVKYTTFFFYFLLNSMTFKERSNISITKHTQYLVCVNTVWSQQWMQQIFFMFIYLAGWGFCCFVLFKISNFMVFTTQRLCKISSPLKAATLVQRSDSMTWCSVFTSAITLLFGSAQLYLIMVIVLLLFSCS